VLGPNAAHEEARICRMESGSVVIEAENLQKHTCRSKEKVEGIYTELYPALDSADRSNA